MLYLNAEKPTLDFFFFFLVNFNCDGYILFCMFVVTVNHAVFWGFVLDILLSLNIITIIVCCMFDV